MGELNFGLLKAPDPIVSFAFNDLVQNAGLIDLKAAKLVDTAAANKFILTTSSAIGSIDTFASKLAGAGTIMAATDFVGEFNRSFNIKGDIIINVPIWITGASGGDDTISVTATVLHNTTTIGTGSVTRTFPAGTATVSGEDISSMIIEDVNFRISIGDTITLRIAAEGNGAGSSNYYVLFDPLNRTGILSNSTSVMRMLLPVRLDF